MVGDRLKNSMNLRVVATQQLRDAELHLSVVWSGPAL